MGVRVGDVEMKMRTGRAAAGVAELGNHLAAFHAIVQLHTKAAVLEMLVEREAAVAKIQRYEVAARILESDGRPVSG